MRRIGLAAPAWEELLAVHRNSVGHHTDRLAAGIAAGAEVGRIGLDSDHIALESGPADLAPRKKVVRPVGEHNRQTIADRRSSGHRWAEDQMVAHKMKVWRLPEVVLEVHRTGRYIIEKASSGGRARVSDSMTGRVTEEDRRHESEMAGGHH